MGTDHKGFGDLQTAADLFSKLEHDLGRMNESPEDTFAAFDFFVTAEHMIDWMYPDESESGARSDLRRNVRMLEIVSHLANGNKHFQATQNRHKSVKGVEESHSGFHPNAFSTKAFSPEAFQFVGLTIELDDGSYVHALELAEDVLEYWQNKIENP